ncbi:MAG: hypothetical protein HY791_17445 [Deltaproteobacteria bacterium]|nr:hypothetical protein [Deltaproteobacteria bacterium]
MAAVEPSRLGDAALGPIASVRGDPGLILALAGLLSFSSLCYELLIVRVLTELIGDAVVFQALTIGTYLAAVGVGGFWASSGEDPRRRLISIEVALVAFGALLAAIVFMLYVGVKLAVFPGAVDFADVYDHASRARWIFVGSAEGLTAVLGLLTGFELPLLLRWASLANAPSPNRVLAANYFGGLLGTLVFTWLLLPRLSAIQSGVIVAVGFNGLALVLIWRRRVLAVLVIAMIAPLFLLGPWVERVVTKSFYYGVGVERPGFSKTSGLNEMWARPEIDRERSVYQVIDLVRADEAFEGRPMSELYLNGRIQVSPSWSAAYHESLVHIPVQFFRRVPKNVLVLGGGDGVIVREILKYRAVERVTMVELDGRMIELARSHPWFLEQNGGALFDAKVEVIVADAVGWLRRNRETFDAVYVDFPDPVGYDLLKLYSVEVYRMIGWALADGGFLALDVPIYSAVQVPSRPKEFLDWNTRVFSTLEAARMRQVIPFRGAEHSFIAARGEPSDVSRDWVDRGIPLSFLSADSFRRARRFEFPHELDRSRVVSMFWPPLTEFPDPVF